MASHRRWALVREGKLSLYRVFIVLLFFRRSVAITRYEALPRNGLYARLRLSFRKPQAEPEIHCVTRQSLGTSKTSAYSLF